MPWRATGSSPVVSQFVRPTRFVIIGGGPGGNTAANYTVRHGAEVERFVEALSEFQEWQDHQRVHGYRSVRTLSDLVDGIA